MPNWTGIREAVDHGGTLGDETELAWREFLARVLPPGTGWVTDSCGCRRMAKRPDGRHCVRQAILPTLVHGRKCPIHSGGGRIRGVRGETTDRPKNLRLACLKAASVRALGRTSAAIPSADGTLGPKPPHRILGGILALSNSYSGGFGSALGHMMGRVPEAQRLDLGCALNHGSFTVSYGETIVESVVESPADTSAGNLSVPVAGGPAGYRDCACHRLFSLC